MKVTHTQADIIYGRILQDVQHSQHRLLILPAKGVDALCSCKILSNMLAVDRIPYQIQPVTGYDDIAYYITDFHIPTQPSSIILLNCGANIDLREFLQLDLPEREELFVYVFDSHRPLNLSNIDMANKRIRVMLNFLDNGVEFPENLSSNEMELLDTFESGVFSEKILEQEIQLYPWSDDEEFGNEYDNYIKSEISIDDDDDDSGDNGDSADSDDNDDNDGYNDNDDDDDDDHNNDDQEGRLKPEGTERTEKKRIKCEHKKRKRIRNYIENEGEVEGENNTHHMHYNIDEDDDYFLDKEDKKVKFDADGQVDDHDNSNKKNLSDFISLKPTNFDSKPLKKPISISKQRQLAQKKQQHEEQLYQQRKLFIQKKLEKKMELERDVLFDRVEILNEYYRIGYVSLSSAFTVFSMSYRLQKHTNDFVWNVLLTITYNFIHNLIDQDQYELVRSDMSTILPQFDVNNSNNAHTRDQINVLTKSSFPQLDDFSDNTTNNNNNNSLTTTSATNLSSSPPPQTMFMSNLQGNIRNSTEFRFPFLRFWNLYDAVRYSTLSASVLRLWTRNGEREMMRLFARSKIYLKNAKNDFSLLPESTKIDFLNDLKINGPTFGLPRTTYESFIRRHTNIMEISAADFSLALDVLTEFEAKVDPETQTSTQTQTNSQGSQSQFEQAQQSSSHHILSSNSSYGFWKAYEALGSAHSQSLNEGIEYAKKLQVAIIKQGIAMMMDKNIHTSSLLHTATVESCLDHELFAKPNALLRLGTFILELIAINTLSRPLVVSIYIEAEKSYLVAGLSSLDKRQHRTGYSAFGRMFKEAANILGTQTKHDGFDSSLILVEKDHLQRFLKQLGIMLAKSGNTLLTTAK